MVATRYAADKRAANARLSDLKKTVVRTHYGDVEYTERGSGEPAVLVVHGIFGGCDAGLLSLGGTVTDRRVIAPSRFGYLGSTMPDEASPAMQADALAELLDTLQLSKVDVISYSAGSTSALELALRHPDRLRHLVVMCGDLPGPTAKSAPPVTKLVYRSGVVMWAATKVARSALMHFIGGLPAEVDLTRLPDDQQQTLNTMLDSIFPVGPRSAGVIFDAFVGNPAVNSFPFEALQVPTLFVHAKDDTLAAYVGAMNAAPRVPGARLVTLATGGHLFLGQSAAVREHATRFIGAAGPMAAAGP